MKLVLVLLTASLLSARASIHDLKRSILHFEIDQPVFEDAATNHFEVYYHAAGGTEFIRKVQRASGTGFCVVHHNASYIVTAAHVAGAPESSGSIELVDTNGQALRLELNYMRSCFRGAKWFFHPLADVAIHPFARPSGLASATLDLREDMLSTNPLPLLSPVVALAFPVNLGTIGGKLSPIANLCEISSGLTQVPGLNPGLHAFLTGNTKASSHIPDRQIVSDRSLVD